MVREFDIFLKKFIFIINNIINNSFVEAIT